MDVNAETARKLREMGAAEAARRPLRPGRGRVRRDGVRRARPGGGGRGALRLHHAEGPQPDEEGRPQVPPADVRSVDFFEGRGLDRVAVAELATCGFVGRGENVVLRASPARARPTWPARSRRPPAPGGVRSCYVRQPDLEDLWRESRDRPGGERKARPQVGAFGLLVIDEWLLDRPDTEFRSMLLELMELRYGTASTVFCTQFKKKDWHPRLGGGVHADAIMDRIVHNAVWVDMGEANMRQRRG